MFFVDLLLGSTPVSEAPYQIAPTESKELKEKLKELIDKDSSVQVHHGEL